MSSRRTWVIRSILLATALLAAVAIYAWQPDRPLAELTERWALPPSQWLRVDGVDTHVRDEGRADDPLPVILIHGTSASLHTWDGWVGSLASERRVIRYDLPGFGLTGPADDHDYRLQRYVRHLTRLLDRLQIERAVLVGNSLGGQIAWASAVLAPDRVAGLVLIDAAGYPFKPKSIPIGFRLALNPTLAPLVRHLLPRPIVAASVRDTYGDPTRVSDALIDRYFELTLRAGNRQAVIERFQQLDHGEMSQRIVEVRVPTLILWGARDRLIPPENGALFQADIADSELVEFEDLGHVPHEEDPVRTVAAAGRFLALRACGDCTPASER